MKYTIHTEEKQPAYLQLYEQIKADIIQEHYPYHSKLPSKRLLADELEISTVTVEHAYALLCDEGYIEPKERSGYFVIFRLEDGFLFSSRQPSLPIAPFEPEASESLEFPFSTLTKTMRSVMSNYGKTILDRSPGSGRIELRQAIRQYLARSRGIIADTDQIIVGSGSEYLYSLIVELLDRDRIYAIESPSYKKIEQVYQASDVRYERLPLGIDGIESHALWATDAAILHITPYRSFPSGVSASASKRHEYVRWAQREGRYMIEDDYESEFSISKKSEETLFSLSQKDNVIYMNTFSQTISSALRIGYMVLPKHLVLPFEKKLGFYSCTVSTFMQLVVAELLSSGDFERHINRVRRYKRKLMNQN